jgi:hypothetical protein
MQKLYETCRSYNFFFLLFSFNDHPNMHEVIISEASVYYCCQDLELYLIPLLEQFST